MSNNGMQIVYFITHPEVSIDPSLPVPDWHLSEKGVERMKQLLSKQWIQDVKSIYSSSEQKAIDGAEILSSHLSLKYVIISELGENDRSSTGYLPKEEFNAIVKEFFSHPNDSIRGWETAFHAQQRIIEAIDSILKREYKNQKIAIISHGGVGTLYLSHLKGCSISVSEDQPGSGGGNYFAFDALTKKLLQGWTPIDS